MYLSVLNRTRLAGINTKDMRKKIENSINSGGRTVNAATSHRTRNYCITLILTSIYEYRYKQHQMRSLCRVRKKLKNLIGCRKLRRISDVINVIEDSL